MHNNDGVQHSHASLLSWGGSPTQVCPPSRIHYSFLPRHMQHRTYLGPKLLANLKLLGDGLAIVLPGTSLSAESVLDPLGCVLGNQSITRDSTSGYRDIASEFRVYSSHDPRRKDEKTNNAPAVALPVWSNRTPKYSIQKLQPSSDETVGT